MILQMDFMGADTWAVISALLAEEGKEKLTYDLKPQLAALGHTAIGSLGARLGAVQVAGDLVDVRIAAWLITPDEEIVSDNPHNVGLKVRTPRWDPKHGEALSFGDLGS